MSPAEEIEGYLESLAEPKQADMRALHRIIQQVMPGCRLWFVDGKDDTGKTVSNPNVGYGLQTIRYADGRTRPFYQVGISANTTGISVYILGLADRTYLARTYGATIGKASVTGYCIKFRTLGDVNTEVLESVVRHAAEATGQD